jgi:hypothetical protein
VRLYDGPLVPLIFGYIRHVSRFTIILAERMVNPATSMRVCSMPLLVALITANIVLGALIWSDATAQRRMSERLSAKDPALDIEVGPNLGLVTAPPSSGAGLRVGSR